MAFTASLVVSTAQAVADTAYYLIEEYDPKKAGLAFTKLVQNTLKLAVVAFGGLEMAVAAAAISLGLTLHKISEEVQKEDRYIEIVGATLLAGFKANSLSSKVNKLVEEKG